MLELSPPSTNMPHDENFPIKEFWEALGCSQEWELDMILEQTLMVHGAGGDLDIEGGDGLGAGTKPAKLTEWGRCLELKSLKSGKFGRGVDVTNQRSFVQIGRGQVMKWMKSLENQIQNQN